MFSLASQRWHRLPKMNVARTGHTLVVLEQVAAVGRLCLILYFFHYFRLSLLLAVALTLQNGWTLITVRWISSNAIIVLL